MAAPAETAFDDALADVGYKPLTIPSMDGRRATELDIRFSGSGSLEPADEDDLALLEAMRLGEPVRLIVVGSIAGKGFRLGTGDDPAVSFSCTVRVEHVEAGEIA